MTTMTTTPGGFSLTFSDETGGRRCGGCTACCKLVPVASLQKKAGQRCQHQRQSCGCAIYAKRPFDCRAWSCQWLVNPAAGRLRRPDRSHYVIDIMPDVIRLTPDEGAEPIELSVVQVWVDPAYPNSWRDPALLAYLEQLAEKDGTPALLRYNNDRAVLLAAPCLSSDGQWHERDAGAPNPNFGRYSRLPPNERPPL